MRRSAVLCATTLAAVACGGERGEWGGTVADSAGVAIVQNPLDADWTLQSRPQLVEELRIGSEDGAPAYQFGRVAAIDVDPAGRIHVLDQQAAQVRVFDRDGVHVRTVGRPGGGPGELSMATAAVLAAADDVIYVADMQRMRIAAFGADGSEIGSSPLDLQQGIPIRFDVSPSKQFVMQTRVMRLPGMPDTVHARDRILLRDPASAQVDSVLVFESGGTLDFSGGTARFRLFEPEPIWALLHDGRVAHGRNDTFRIEVRAVGGALQRVIVRPVERRAVTETDRKAFLDGMRVAFEQQLAGQPPQAVAAVRQMLEATPFADYYPAYMSMMSGPGGTLWVQRIRTADDVQKEGGTFDARDVGSNTWDIFDGDGRLLGPIRMPDRFQPLRVHDAHIYGVLRDALDIEHVVRLRVDGLAAS